MSSGCLTIILLLSFMVLKVNRAHLDGSVLGFSCDWSHCGDWDWSHLKASSSTCLVVDVGCQLGPQLGHWVKHLYVACPCVFLGFITA